MLTFPVVSPFRLKYCRTSCSPIAPILSILLPSISTGQLITCSSANNESNSAFDSINLCLSQTSIRKTIASTAGKYSFHTLRTN